MYQKTIIPTQEKLSDLKGYYDFLFQSKGQIIEEELRYQVAIPALYFEPIVIFRAADEAAVKAFQSRSKYADVHFVFGYQKALNEYGTLLEEKSIEADIPDNLKEQLKNNRFRMDFVLEMPDKRSYKFQYLHIDTCGTPANRHCQSCEISCMSSFEEDLTQDDFEIAYICKKMKQYFNQDWVKA